MSLDDNVSVFEFNEDDGRWTTGGLIVQAGSKSQFWKFKIGDITREFLLARAVEEPNSRLKRKDNNKRKNDSSKHSAEVSPKVKESTTSVESSI